MTLASVLIVDDAPLARRRAIRLLRQFADVGSIDEAGDIVQARRILARKSVDVLLLDIEMPGGDGFELLDGLEELPGAVIFVTASDDRALRGFEVRAVDYITKPVELGRFRIAFGRAVEVVGARAQADRIAELTETVNALRKGADERSVTELWVKRRGDYFRVPTSDIIRFEADRDYVHIHAGAETHLHHESLASLDRRLNPDEFMRIHRSTIVRKSAIVRIRRGPSASLMAVLADGTEVRVGRTFARTVRSGLARSI